MKTGNDQELLSAYMDGELAPDELEAVDELLEKDGTAREFVLDAVRVNARLRGRYNSVLSEEIPPRLHDTVETTAPISYKTPAIVRNLARIAAVLVFVTLGFGAGNLFNRPDSGSILTRLDGMPAELMPVVADVLENNLSGSPRQWSSRFGFDPITVTPVKTYRDDNGRFFREYTLEFSYQGRQRRVIGLAYRTEAGLWNTKALFFESQDNSI